MRIPEERRSFLEVLFHELEEASDPHRRDEPYAVQRSLLTLVLNEVRRAARWDAEASGASRVVAESLAFIERNCLRPLTLKEVAAAVGKSPAYVTTALSRATGRSAVEWIIAGRVGYADPTHFIRMFQREHGATPAAWRAAKSLSP